LRFRAIACDYDGTLADEGQVRTETIGVLRRCRATSRKLLLVTGRSLDDLRTVFSDLSLFDLVVAENGALLFDPSLGSEEPLCAAPPANFLTLLRERGIPFTVGKQVVATIRPYEIDILKLVKETNLRLDVAFNRESVMVLPSDVDKGTGLITALARLGIAPAEVVGIGDAENDLPFLRLCGFSVAVANAIESLKEQVDVVTRAGYGAGATEIIDGVVAGADLAGWMSARR
jgi:phosphoglycolate phosphatase (TIGR01487 family)